jgi:hypothetical protein
MAMRNHKLIAALMLAVLLPSTVFAASLRYCMGENGHRGIELAHAKDSRPTPGINRSAPSVDVALGTLHLTGQHCQDRLLLPAAAKSEACQIRPPRPESVLEPVPRSQVNVRPKRRVDQASSITASYRQPPDPRLAAIRTVVLLN